MLHRMIGDRVNTIAPFLAYDSDPYVVVGADGHLYWIQDAYTTSNMFPYSEPLVREHLPAGRQLHPQLGEGGHRRLQRQSLLLRHRPERSADPHLPQDLPEPLQADQGDARLPEKARALSDGPVHGPGPDVRHLPHDRPPGVLQPRGPLEHPPGDLQGGAAVGPALLHHHAPAPLAARGVHPHASPHPGQQGQHGGLDVRPLRRRQLRPAPVLHPLQGEADLRPDADRGADQPEARHLLGSSPSGGSRARA